jgi:hypothetical protein
VYEDDTALAGWADRLAHPPASVEAPADVALPETSTGRPLRQGVPLPVDRSLNVKDPESAGDAADQDLLPYVSTTSELLLTVSKRTVRFEGREILPVPADPTRGFDAKYKHSEADIGLLEGSMAPLGYARERAYILWKALGRYESPGLLVMADRDLPCRLLVEILFTAAQHYFVPHLLGRRAGRVVDVNISSFINRLDWLVRVAVLPHAFELEIPHERGVIVECDRGTAVDGAGAPLIEGVQLAFIERVQLASVRKITIPRRDDSHDFEALSGCARRVERAFSHDLMYRVEPAPAVSVQMLVSTVDALRKDAARNVEIAVPVIRGHAP